MNGNAKAFLTSNLTGQGFSLMIWAHFRRFAPETGLFAAIQAWALLCFATSSSNYSAGETPEYTEKVDKKKSANSTN
jgi:hypothetical protein